MWELLILTCLSAFPSPEGRLVTSYTFIESDGYSYGPGVVWSTQLTRPYRLLFSLAQCTVVVK
jgi:hypothetical protein